MSRMVDPLFKEQDTNPPWPKARAERLERDNHTCQASAYGITTDCTDKWLGLQVHHRLPRGRGGTNHQDNLVTLCAGHHAWAESKRADARAVGMLL